MMDIKTTTKKVIKGQAILDLKKQAQDALNVINSVVLNIEAAIKEIKKDSSFSYQEAQEFKNILNFILLETMNKRHDWLEKFYDIKIE